MGRFRGRSAARKYAHCARGRRDEDRAAVRLRHDGKSPGQRKMQPKLSLPPHGLLTFEWNDQNDGSGGELDGFGCEPGRRG